VVYAETRLTIKPKAAVLRLLATHQTGKVKVDFVQQVLRKILRSEGMRLRIVTVRRIEDNG
jgi:hypothetical protein